MAWLLGRRGYSPVVFEQNARVGGKVHNSAASAQKEEHLHFIYIYLYIYITDAILNTSSLPPSLPSIIIAPQIWTQPTGQDGIIREMGAAFLSPDYDEVRGLAARYGATTLPISVSKEMQFHSATTDTPEPVRNNRSPGHVLMLAGILHCHSIIQPICCLIIIIFFFFFFPANKNVHPVSSLPPFLRTYVRTYIVGAQGISMVRKLVSKYYRIKQYHCKHG